MHVYEPYTPVIQNPYPTGWREVRGFRCATPVMLTRPIKPHPDFQREHEEQYINVHEFVVSCEVDGRAHDIRAPAGMLTDLASIPRCARGIVGRVGRHLEAVIMHDYLSVAWQDMREDGAAYRPTEEDLRFSNAVLREGLLEAGYSRAFARLAEYLGAIPWARRRFYAANPYPRYVRVLPTSPPPAQGAIGR